MTILDFVDRHFEPIFGLFGVGLVLFFLRIFGEPIERIVKALVGEIRELLTAEYSRGSINAVGGICIFFIICFLTFAPTEFLIGNISGKTADVSETISRYCLVGFSILIFSVFLLLSIRISK